MIHTDIKNMLAEPPGFDCVIEDAFVVVKRSGTLMLFGVAPHEARISLSPFRIYHHKVMLLGSMTVLFSFQPALDLLRGGVINTHAMLTTTFPLEQFPDALKMVRNGEGVKTHRYCHMGERTNNLAQYPPSFRHLCYNEHAYDIHET